MAVLRAFAQDTSTTSLFPEQTRPQIIRIAGKRLAGCAQASFDWKACEALLKGGGLSSEAWKNSKAFGV
jgi:hypothetical protein